MDSYNEKAGVEFRAAFFDNLGQGTIPSTIHWRLDCETNKRAITTEDVEVFPEPVTDDDGTLSVSVLIEVPGSLNAILNQKNVREKKLLLVIANKDLDNEFSTELPYWILNKQGRS